MFTVYVRQNIIHIYISLCTCIHPHWKPLHPLSSCLVTGLFNTDSDLFFHPLKSATNELALSATELRQTRSFKRADQILPPFPPEDVTAQLFETFYYKNSKDGLCTKHATFYFQIIGLNTEYTGCFMTLGHNCRR